VFGIAIGHIDADETQLRGEGEYGFSHI
jgi:hypothetical protein